MIYSSETHLQGNVLMWLMKTLIILQYVHQRRESQEMVKSQTHRYAFKTESGRIVFQLHPERQVIQRVCLLNRM